MMLQDCLKSRYLLYRNLRDAGIDTGRACLAVDLLCGPEPAEGDDQVGPALEWSHPVDPQFEPAPEDALWLAMNPSLPPIRGGAPDDDDRWADYAAYRAWQDALEASHHRITDRDVMVATGCAG